MKNPTFTRMCIVCRKRIHKNEMHRIVRTAQKNAIQHTEKKYFFDKTSGAEGRGAYICKTQECIQKAIKTKALNRAFKANVGEIIEAMEIIFDKKI